MKEWCPYPGSKGVFYKFERSKCDFSKCPKEYEFSKNAVNLLHTKWNIHNKFLDKLWFYWSKLSQNEDDASGNDPYVRVTLHPSTSCTYFNNDQPVSPAKKQRTKVVFETHVTEPIIGGGKHVQWQKQDSNRLLFTVVSKNEDLSDSLDVEPLSSTPSSKKGNRLSLLTPRRSEKSPKSQGSSASTARSMSSNFIRSATMTSKAARSILEALNGGNAPLPPNMKPSDFALTVSVWDNEVGNSDRLIGDRTINLQEIIRRPNHTFSMRSILKSEDGQYAGRLEFSIKFGMLEKLTDEIIKNRSRNNSFSVDSQTFVKTKTMPVQHSRKGSRIQNQILTLNTNTNTNNKTNTNESKAATKIEITNEAALIMSNENENDNNDDKTKPHMELKKPMHNINGFALLKEDIVVPDGKLTVIVHRGFYLMDIEPDSGGLEFVFVMKFAFYAMSFMAITSLCFAYLEGWTWDESFYFCVFTVLTVGYGDVAPITVGGKIACILVISLLVGLIFVSFTFTMQFIAQKRELQRCSDDDALLEELSHQSDENMKNATIQNDDQTSNTLSNKLDTQASSTINKESVERIGVMRADSLDEIVEKVSKQYRQTFLQDFSQLFGWIAIWSGFFCIIPTEKMSLIDAIYFSFVTASTVGYGDVKPSSIYGRIFCSLFMIFGVTFLAKLANSVANYLMLKRKIIHESEMMNRLLVTDEQFSDFDISGHGYIDKFDFLAHVLVSTNKVPESTIVRIMHKFNEFDTDKDGKIQMSDIKRVTDQKEKTQLKINKMLSNTEKE